MSMFDWLCGPEHCGIGGWLFDYQTFVSGVLAIAAAVGTAWVVWRAASLPVVAAIDRERRLNAARLEYLRHVLTNEFLTIGERARHAASTVKVFKASNKDVTDDTKDKMHLAMPAVLQDWEAMSLLGPDVIKECSELARLVERHNFDVRRAGGSFGDDNFGRRLMDRAKRSRPQHNNWGNIRCIIRRPRSSRKVWRLCEAEAEPQSLVPPPPI